jgi:hypothetical protein
MKHYVDKIRLKGLILKEGDKVYLLRRNLKTKRLSSKLDWKKLGPFKIETKISEVNYKLTLLPTMKIHPVFHILLLEPTSINSKLIITVELDENQEYEVERILDKR